MNNIKLSFIIPVYNAEKYIVTCYESLVRLSFNDWEAIFINDGSTDSSLEILNDIHDERIRIISRPNTGVALAREDGIKEAKGEWVTFVDVDDYIVSNSFSKLMTVQYDSDVSIVLGGYNVIGRKTSNTVSLGCDDIITFRELLKRLSNQSIRWHIWGNIYRRQLFSNEILTPRLNAGEDMAIFIQLCSKANKILLSHLITYNYVQVASSASHVKGIPYLHDALEACFFVKKTLYSICDKQEIEYLNSISLLILFVCIIHRLPLSDEVGIRTVNECFSVHSLNNIPLIKRVPVLGYYFLQRAQQLFHS